MTQDVELAELMQAIAEKSMKLWTSYQHDPQHIPSAINQYIELTEQVIQMSTAVLQNPEKVWSAQTRYWQDAMELARQQMEGWLHGNPPPIADKRFSQNAWVNNPFFNMLSQHYLLASNHINTLVESMDFGDKAEAKKMQFFMRQYLDALSPSNFIHTNPEILSETIKSHGKNLVQGLHNLLSDMEQNATSMVIEMTDKSAFKIGENLATTPGKVIFRNDLMELIQYTPKTEKVKSIPLLMIPPWINKYYILDLSPNNSLVSWLVSEGITAFMISWVNPNEAYAQKSFYNYMDEGPVTAIEVIKKQLDVRQVNTLGFCIGGTLQAAMLAYKKAHQDDSVHSSTFLATMIDFSDPGDISVYIDEQQIRKLEEEMKEKGYLAGSFMANSFNSLRANDLIWSFFVKNYLQGKKPVPFDILYWNADSTNMPSTMHSQYLRWMYLHNNLIKPGKISLNKTPLDVSQIDTPSFFLSTQKDHIAPWKTTYIGFQAFKGPKRFVLGGSGHIAGIINPAGSDKYGYHTNNNAPQNPDDWYDGAKEHRGSWWPEWSKWLKAHSGKLIKAADITKLPYAPLMDAPGSYVRNPSDKT